MLAAKLHPDSTNLRLHSRTFGVPRRSSAFLTRSSFFRGVTYIRYEGLPRLLLGALLNLLAREGNPSIACNVRPVGEIFASLIMWCIRTSQALSLPYFAKHSRAML
mmetsp:Transcript_18053/g.68462  ORF Transcript_18053/g.68462 Transcript_18053/m.68462 type:complete len:106 (-) Transcript_18053:1670-1987(-)